MSDFVIRLVARDTAERAAANAEMWAARHRLARDAKAHAAEEKSKRRSRRQV